MSKFFRIVGIVLLISVPVLYVIKGDSIFESKMELRNFSYHDNTLFFKPTYLKYNYELTLPPSIQIKPSDKVEVTYLLERDSLQRISEIYLNDTLVYNGREPLILKQIQYKQRIFHEKN